MRLATLGEVNEARAARRSVIVVTALDDGSQRLLTADTVATDPLAPGIEDRVRTGASGVVEHEGRRFFVGVQVPSVRLVLVGAVHISQALAPMAGLAGLDVTVVDPRTAFASPERFDGVRLVTDWPDTALPAIGLDRYTAVAVLTHDPKIDDPALEAALRSDCFYLGALGSRKSHAARLGRLAAAGFDATATARIHGPIGLDIGAVSPAEIAVSILAEAIAAMRKKPPRAAG